MRKQNLDIPGMILYGLAIFFIMVGFSMLPHFNGIFILGAGAVCLIVLLVLEYRWTTLSLIYQHGEKTGCS